MTDSTETKERTEQQRAKAYALSAHITATSRIEGFFKHLEKQDLDFDETDDMLFDGARAALDVLKTAHSLIADGAGDEIEWVWDSVRANAEYHALQNVRDTSRPSVSEVIEAVEGKPEDEAA